MINTLSKDGYPVYPALNIYMSPRVQQQKVQNQSTPLIKYIKPITSSIVEQNNLPIPPRQYLRNFHPADGMIYNFGDRPVNENGVGNIKILICICMYNEGGNAINLTLGGIYQNLPALEKEGIASDQIAVVLIQDGILKLLSDRKRRKFAGGKNSMIQFYKQIDMHEGKTKCQLEERLNIITDSIHEFDRKGKASDYARNRDFPPNIQKNIALLYQNLWDPSVTSAKDQKGHKFKNPFHSQKDKNSHKLRVFTAFKHSNGTKLSSHLLFFEGFCRFIKPQFCVLLDVGTKPAKKGLIHLIRGFYMGKNIGGCTGLMSIDSKFESLEGGQEEEPDIDEILGRNQDKKKKKKKPDGEHNICRRALMSIQKAQQYEYVMAHFLDKNAQSALGFLHVLPGAWSAYRYEALIKTQKYEPNLLERSYFKTILTADFEEEGYQEANMYLAQDRILSLGIYCQINSKYTLKYVPDAIAYTDPMKDHKNLMNQRRRWINSSLFAFLYVFRNYYYNVQESRHNCCRKYITLNISMFLSLLSFVNSYFTPALYWFILYISMIQIQYYKQYVSIIAIVISGLYVMLVLVVVGGSLAGKMWTQKAQYASYGLTAFVILTYALVIYNLFFLYLDVQEEGLHFDDYDSVSVIILIGINLFCFFFVIFMHIPTHCRFVCRLILDQISYTMYIGAYSQTMVIYGFCNIDDVSWGTKGAGGHGGKPKYFEEKVYFVSNWLFWNCILAFILLYIDIVVPQRQQDTQGGKLLLIIGYYSTAIILTKSILAIVNHFKWLFCQRCCSHINVSTHRKKDMKNYFDKMDKNYVEEMNSLLNKRKSWY